MPYVNPFEHQLWGDSCWGLDCREEDLLCLEAVRVLQRLWLVGLMRTLVSVGFGYGL